MTDMCRPASPDRGDDHRDRARRSPTTSHGKIFALADAAQPERGPQAVHVQRPRAAPRPSRGPSYRWYPMSWMTLGLRHAAASFAGTARPPGAGAGPAGAAAGPARRPRRSIRSYASSPSSGTSSARPSRRDRQAQLRSARAASTSVPSLTSTASTSDAAVIAEIRSARSSRPPSIAIRRVADPLDLAEQVRADDHGDAELGADPVHQRPASRRGRPGRARWSARPAAAGRGRVPAPGPASPAASCRSSSRRSGGTAPRRARRGAASPTPARGRPSCGSPLIRAMWVTNSAADTSGGRQSFSGM